MFLYTKPKKVEIEGEKFYFVPFPYKTLRPGYINVAHIEPAGALRDNGKPVKDGQEVPKEIYLVNGHIHTHQVGKNYLLPGTLYQCNFGEKLPKGFCHIKVVKGKVNYKFVEIKPSFTFNTLYVESADDWLKISKKETDFYRVYIQSSMTVPDEVHNYNNVLQLSGKIQEEQRADVDMPENSSEIRAVSDDEDELRLYLKDTFRYNKFQVRRSMELRERARSAIAVENRE